MVAFIPDPQTLLDGGGADGIRQARATRSLTRRRLSLSTGQHATHKHFINLLR
jgi:hypothetical protein